MLPKSFLPVLLAAAAVLPVPPLSAQVPSYLAPLWENTASGGITPLSIIGEESSPPFFMPPPEEPSGFAPMSVPLAISGEIQSLAEALDNDPVKIFNHVRNTIDYEQYLGLRKGPELTLLEGSGNDLDTCALLAELLRAAGISQIEYRYQISWVPVSEVPAWLGLADEPWPGWSFEQVFGQPNPFPASDLDVMRVQNALRFLQNRQAQGMEVWWENGPSIGFYRFWLGVEYQGETYDLDPSFKRYEKFPGIDLKTAIGYNLSGKDRAALLSTAGGTPGNGSIVDLNNANIGNFLNARTQDLLAALQSQYAGWTVEEIVKGRKIIKEEIAGLGEAYPLPDRPIWFHPYDNPPEEFKSRVTFQIEDQDPPFSIPTAELKGRKVALAASGNEVQLWIDDEKVSWTTVTNPTYSFTIKVTHPNFANPYRETKTYKKHNQSVYAIIYGFKASDRLIRMRYEELQKHLKTDANGTGREARSEILNIMSLTWLYQTQLATAALAAQNEVIDLSHQRFGRMAQEQGSQELGCFYIDVGLQIFGHYPADGIQDGRMDNVFHLGFMFQSAMEHGVIEQLQPGSSAISTVNILRRANQTGNKRICRIDKALVQSGAAWNAMKSSLPTYSSESTKNGVYNFGLEPFTDTNGNGIWDEGEDFDDYTELQQFEYYALNGGTVVNGVNTGGVVILPGVRNVSQGQWNGSGWVLRGGRYSGVIIDGTYSGGYSTNWGWVAPAPITNVGYTNPSYSYKPPTYTTTPYIAPSYSTPKFFGSDPVDMATGAFTFANTDMETGVEGAPRGLAFSRQYSSNMRGRNDQRIGYGWTHSLDIRASDRTATEEALGLGTPRQMAPFLVAMTVASDLYRPGASVKENVIAALVTGWYVDRLTNNAVSVGIGDQTYQFLRIPGGGFEPPTGSTMTMTQSGTGNNRTYRLKQRNSNEFIFERAAGNTDGSRQRIKEIVDPDGRKMTFSYLAGTPENRINHVEDAAGRRYTFRYDGSNRIDRITDSTDARFVGFAYDGEGNLITHTDPEGKNFHYDYTIPGGQTPPDPGGTAASEHRIVRLRNHDNQIVTQNVYDGLGRVAEQYHHGDTAATWKLRYTGFANTEEDPEGGLTVYYYDERGRSTGRKDADGNVESWAYDAEDRIIEKTTGSGETTVYHYDNKHNITQIDHPRGGGSTHMAYDSLGRIDLVTDPDGHQTDYIYNGGNPKDRPDQIIDPAGTTAFLYKADGPAIGRISQSTDQNNLVTEYEYDATYGQPLWIKSGNFTTSFLFNGRGDLLQSTDPNGITTLHTYNKRRQITQTTGDHGGADQSVENFTYDNQGNPESATGALFNDGQRFKTRHQHSATNKVRFTWTSSHDGIPANDPETKILYDGRDWQREIHDPLGRLTTLTPHANGELHQTTFDGRTTTRLVDGDGRPISGTSPGSDAERTGGMAYDTSPSGHPRTIVTTPDGLSVSEVSDRSGRVRFHTNRKSNVWEFRYDGLGRRTHVITPLDAAASRAQVTEYNHRGRVTKITQPSGKVANFTYHATTGRLTGVSDPVGTISHTGYDNNGNLLATSETRTGVPGAKTTTRTYDRQNRLKSRTDENGQTIGYRHYPSGKIWKIIYPGGSESGTGHVEYTWWNDGNLKQVIDKLDSTASPRITGYEWHKDGRLKKVTRPNNTVREIKYDAAGRPEVVEEYGPGMKLIFVHKHGYYPSDEMAWRYQLPAKRTSGTDPPAIPVMTYNADNQLATWDGQTVIHDADGNMTTGPSSRSVGVPPTMETYAYDARNRLTAALGTSYVYDADGQRVALATATDTTTFVTDTGSALSKVLVRTKNGITTRYVWGLGLLYEVSSSGETVSYHHDATGSTLALTDGSATVIERIGYTPWGQIDHRINRNGTFHDTPFLFTGFFGNQTDEDGLLYMRNRYYHPLIGRFLNADPAQEGMNWYGYAAGNPIGFVDPLGLGITGAINSVQNTLSFLGMVPVFGAAFDIVNAGISIGRGNYVDAAVNVASAIPGFGDYIGAAKIAGGAATLYGGYKGVSAVSGGYFSGVANNATRWGPTTGAGPLGEGVAATFRGGSYTQMVTQEATTLYRSYGGRAGELGSYWTRTAPAGPLQTRIDNALLPKWGNTAENVSTISVPRGTTIYEGFAAPQGNLMGGGSQIFIPQVNRSWLTR